MPSHVTCPSCQRQLRVPEHLLGRAVRCPGCGESFRADADGQGDESAGPPSAQRDEDTYTERPRRAPDDLREDERADYDRDDDMEPRRRQRRKRPRPHSGLGIASCIIAVIAAALIFLTIVVAAIAEAREGNWADTDP